MTISEMPVAEESREKRVAAAQPVRLISIDEITIGELVSLQFKMLFASIPVAFVIGIVWLIVRAMIEAMSPR